MGEAIKVPCAARGECAPEDEVETIFADVAISFDCGETIRCLLYVHDPDGRRRPLQWVVLPRAGYMISLVEAADEFLGGQRGGGSRIAVRASLAAFTFASLMLH